MGGLKYTVPPFTKCGVSKGEGAEVSPSEARVKAAESGTCTGPQDGPREVERTRSATSPRKVGDCSLATFRTSAIFENDRVQAEVLAQC